MSVTKDSYMLKKKNTNCGYYQCLSGFSEPGLHYRIQEVGNVNIVLCFFIISKFFTKRVYMLSLVKLKQKQNITHVMLVTISSSYFSQDLIFETKKLNRLTLLQMFSNNIKLK